MYRQSEKFVKQQYVLHMSSQYGELRPISGWDWLTSLRHSSKLERVSRWLRYCSDVAQRRSTKLCTICLAVSWAGTLCLYINFRGFFPPNGILQGAKFTLRPSLAFCMTALLHGTRVVGVSQTLLPSRWASARILVYQISPYSVIQISIFLLFLLFL